jgi:sugar-specific transcriptional regulator TrmB
MSEGRLRGVLISLASKGILIRLPDRPTQYTPAPPDIAVEILVLRKQLEIERARIAAREAQPGRRAAGPRIRESTARSSATLNSP